MIDFLDNLQNYSLAKLLNDFYNLMDEMPNGKLNDTFAANHMNEIIDGKMSKTFQCNQMDCVCLMRHFKDFSMKNKDYAQKKKLYFIDEDTSDDFDDLYYEKHKNIKASKHQLDIVKNKVKQKEVTLEIVVQELLDKIHCFVCHPVSMHEWMQNLSAYDEEKKQLDDTRILDGDLKRIMQTIENKMSQWKRIKNMRSINNDLFFQKYTTKLDKTAQMGKHYDYKHVDAKYSNLKTEMLARQRNLNAFAWNDTYKWSSMITKSHKSRKMMTNKDATASIEFIFCLVLYCNHMQIRNGFVSSSNYTEYANMGRILQQNVKIFGVDWNGIINGNNLYHCIVSDDNDLSLRLLGDNRVTFNGPISMTNSFLNIALFESTCIGQENGDRFVFCLANPQSSKYIDCAFVNLYSFEHEMFFMNDCDEQMFHVSNILNIGNGINYILYLRAFKLFDYLMMDNNKENDLKYNLLFDEVAKRELFDDRVQRTLRTLMQCMALNNDEMVQYTVDYDDGSIPLHFEQLFFEICQRKMNIKLNKKAFMNLKDESIERMMFCEYFSIFKQSNVAQSISLNKVKNICPNLVRIYSDFILLNDENVKVLLRMLKENKRGKLNEICIVLNNNQSPNIQKIFNVYRELHKCHWKLMLDDNILKFNVIDK